MSQILAGTTDSLIHLAHVERATERQLRAALLRLGGYVDWDERAVIRFSEAITGRPWSRCGAAEVVQVGRALLDVAVAVRAGNRTDAAWLQDSWPTSAPLSGPHTGPVRPLRRWKSAEARVVTNCDGC